MPTRPRSLCRCGKRSLPTSPRCRAHEAEHQAARNARRTHYHGEWSAISKAARDEWIDTVGPWCPGINRAGHLVDPATLQLDHTTGQVLCNRCNVAAGPAPRPGSSPDDDA